MKLRHALVLVQSFFLAACFLGATLHTATAAPISGLFIFGDSLSDPGNNAILLNPPPSPPNNVTLPSDITGNSFIPTFPYAPSYQYSNGNVWAYQFATMLGLPSAVAGPVLGGGIGSNFAFGGATTGPVNNVGSVPSLLTQAANFVAALGPASAPANALYVVAGGGNNAREAMTAIAGGADPTATIGAAGHSILATSMVALILSVPEIDPAGSSSVVALVIGVLGLIERRRPKEARAPATHRSPAIPC